MLPRGARAERDLVTAAISLILITRNTPSGTLWGPKNCWGQKCGQKPGPRRDGNVADSPSDRRQVGRQKNPQRFLGDEGQQTVGGYRRSLRAGAPKQRLPGAVIESDREDLARGIFEVPSSLSARPEIVNRWITALPERKIDSLHDEIMDFAALFEGGLSQRFVDRFGQVQARMDDI
jgi:hypothetical protein